MPTKARSFLSTVTRAGVIAGKSGSAIAPEKRVSSESTSRTSTWRNTSQARLPFQSVTGHTGAAARAAAYCGGGWNGQVRWNGKAGAMSAMGMWESIDRFYGKRRYSNAL